MILRVYIQPIICFAVYTFVHLFPLFTLDVNVLRSRSNYGIKYERMKRGEMKEWSWGPATLVFKS